MNTKFLWGKVTDRFHL